MNAIQAECITECGYQAGTPEAMDAARATEIALQLWPAQNSDASGIVEMNRRQLRQQKKRIAKETYYKMKAEKGITFAPLLAWALWQIVSAAITWLVEKYLTDHVFANSVEAEVFESRTI